MRDKFPAGSDNNGDQGEKLKTCLHYKRKVKLGGEMWQESEKSGLWAGGRTKIKTQKEGKLNKLRERFTADVYR